MNEREQQLLDIIRAMLEESETWHCVISGPADLVERATGIVKTMTLEFHVTSSGGTCPK